MIPFPPKHIGYLSVQGSSVEHWKPLQHIRGGKKTVKDSTPSMFALSSPRKQPGIYRECNAHVSIGKS